MPEAAEKPPETESGAQPGVFIDPFRAYNFKLVIQGVTEGHFTECHGLGVTIEALEYREGGQNQVVHRIPGDLRLSSPPGLVHGEPVAGQKPEDVHKPVPPHGEGTYSKDDGVDMGKGKHR